MSHGGDNIAEVTVLPIHFGQNMGKHALKRGIFHWGLRLVFNMVGRVRHGGDR